MVKRNEQVIETWQHDRPVDILKDVSSHSVQSLSCVKLFETPCMPGVPVHHQLIELIQTQVYWDGDAIQPSYPL